MKPGPKPAEKSTKTTKTTKASSKTQAKSAAKSEAKSSVGSPTPNPGPGGFALGSAWNKRGFTLKTMLKEQHDVNMGPGEMNYIYNLGASKCAIGEFLEALDLFQFLALCEPSNGLYHKAAGGCLQNLNRFQEAFIAYQTSFIIDRGVSHPDALFYMAFCAIKLQNKENAKDLLTEFLEKHPTHELAKRAALLMKNL